MSTFTPSILGSQIDQHCKLSQSSRTISLSLKRKPCAVNVADIQQNCKEPTVKRRILSLKRHKHVPRNGVEGVPEVLQAECDNKIAGDVSFLEKELGLMSKNQFPSEVKKKGSDKVLTGFDNCSRKAFINETEAKNIKGIVINNSEPDVKSNIIDSTPEVLQNLNTSHKTCIAEGNDDSSIILDDKKSLISVSSATEIGCNINESLDTFIYEKSSYSLSFAFTDCKDVNVTTKNTRIKRILVSQVQNNTNIDCDITANSQDSDNNKLTTNPPKEQVVSVNLEIKKKNLSTSEDQSKVLILNTNAIEKLSHVIVQPPSYKPFRRKIQRRSKFLSNNKSKSVITCSKKNGNVSVDGGKLKQIRIDSFFRNIKDFNGISSDSKDINSKLCNGVRNCENEVPGHDDMNRTARADTARSDGVGRLSRRVSKEENVLSRSSKMSPMSQIRASNSEAPQLPSPRCKNESASSCSPKRNVDSLHFNLPLKTKSNKTALAPREIPYYKIVAGTHFAVDAFCYGDIPGVKNYFLTHFHSDHYSGLKKSFNKALFCTQITADLCISRLGVNIKHIHVINFDETVRVDGVEITAIDANHCPGAVMLLFTLPNGKTLLHTGDFRATAAMESHPAFWNCDIHTIYLDTTYCNPRYDFPTQDQSLEMALHILRQKKMALEKVGKKFTSVLIVCGTYTIGKEKFFLGLARRVGCSVWACPEKDKVLQTVEKRSFSHASPQSCQLHVVPMRDLTHEKLRSYLDSLQGPFSEVVAFKPSGWENGKNTPATKDMVTVHGIPYSEHSSFSEMIRFVNFLKPKQVVPTVDISGGVKAVQKHFPCPLVYKEDLQCQSKLTDFFNVQNRQQISAVS